VCEAVCVRVCCDPGECCVFDVLSAKCARMCVCVLCVCVCVCVYVCIVCKMCVCGMYIRMRELNGSWLVEQP